MWKPNVLAPVYTVTDLYTVYRLSITKHSAAESHDFWELVYAERGTVPLLLGGVAIDLHEGEALLYPPNVVHGQPKDAVIGDNLFDVLSFRCDSEALYTLAGAPIPLSTEQKTLLGTAMREAITAFEPDPEIYGSFRCRANTDARILQKLRIRLELLFLLIDESRRPEGAENMTAANSFLRADEEADRTLAFLQAHLTENLSIEEICEGVGFSESYLRTMFRNRFGTTVMRKMTDLKISEAKRLIASSSMSFSEISDHLGFSAPQYFTRVFRTRVGMSPSEYAKSFLNTL